jgi:uncharacterized protein YfbU (UPF0304 family)
MNNRVVHCGKTYDSVEEGEPMMIRVGHHGHIHSRYLGADMEALLFDNEYVHPRQFCYMSQKNRLDHAVALWEKLCSIFAVWDSTPQQWVFSGVNSDPHLQYYW